MKFLAGENLRISPLRQIDMVAGENHLIALVDHPNLFGDPAIISALRVRGEGGNPQFRVDRVADEDWLGEPETLEAVGEGEGIDLARREAAWWCRCAIRIR